MTIPRWRLAIVAGALIVLSAIGGGLVQAASPSTSPTTAGAATSTPPVVAGERLRALRDRLGNGALGRLRKHLVHGTVTVLDRDGKLIALQFDHGTVSAIGDGSISIAEAGGATVTVGTTAETRVRKDRAAASLGNLTLGDEVVVQSTVEAGSPTAKRIVVLPPAPASAADSGS